jgi:hypothetical protein
MAPTARTAGGIELRLGMEAPHGRKGSYLRFACPGRRIRGGRDKREIGYADGSVPACSATMYSAYQPVQSSSWPDR